MNRLGSFLFRLGLAWSIVALSLSSFLSQEELAAAANHTDSADLVQRAAGAVFASLGAALSASQGVVEQLVHNQMPTALPQPMQLMIAAAVAVVVLCITLAGIVTVTRREIANDE